MEDGLIMVDINMEFRTRKMVMATDLNGSGTLFGGKALSWIDEESAIFATCQLGYNNIVTKAISTIDFKAPAKLGDIVEIGCSLVKFGRTSITVACTIRNMSTKQEILCVNEIVFVAIKDGKAYRHGAKTKEEIEREKEALRIADENFYKNLVKVAERAAYEKQKAKVENNPFQCHRHRYHNCQ